MKKIVTALLIACVAVSVAASGGSETTDQEVLEIAEIAGDQLKRVLRRVIMKDFLPDE